MLSAAQKTELYRAVGKRVREFRGSQMTQEKLARLAGLSRASISNIEAGRHRLPLHHLLQIAQALNKSLNDFMPSMEDLGLAPGRIEGIPVVGTMTDRLLQLVDNMGASDAPDQSPEAHASSTGSPEIDSGARDQVRPG